MLQVLGCFSSYVQHCLLLTEIILPVSLVSKLVNGNCNASSPDLLGLLIRITSNDRTKYCFLNIQNNKHCFFLFCALKKKKRLHTNIGEPYA